MSRRRDRAGGERRSGRFARRALWPVLVAVVLVGVLFVGVYPTQTYLRQREDLDAKQAELASLQEENEAREQRVAELNEPEHLELLAREQYGLVRPGEEVYAIVPAERPPLELPGSWPFTQLQVRLDRLVD